MRIYQLRRVQLLPVDIDTAWQFFSQAGNLSRITPDELGFVVLTRLDNQPIYNTMQIDYIVKPLFGIPLRWTTEIKQVNAPTKFIDKQIRGPYAFWEHTHLFEKVPGGTRMTDEVKYALPLGWLGQMAHWLLVKTKLNHIFDFRSKTLANYFGDSKFAQLCG